MKIPMNAPLKLASLSALTLFAACGSHKPYAALPIENDAEMVSNVVITNADLYDAIRVGKAGVERVEASNQLKVMVPIRNISDYEQQIRVQVSFLNLQKQPIGDDTNEQVKVLSPGMTYTHVAMSSKTEARDWTMRIIPNSR